MGTGGRRAAARRAKIPVYSGPLGKWGAILTIRGNPIARLEATGPLVTASNPDELAQRTELVTGNVNPSEKKEALPGRQNRSGAFDGQGAPPSSGMNSADPDEALPELSPSIVADDDELVPIVDEVIRLLSQAPDLARMRDEALLQEDVFRLAHPDAWAAYLRVEEVWNTRWAFSAGQQSTRCGSR